MGIKGLPQALIHLNAHLKGPVTSCARLWTFAKTPNNVKVWKQPLPDHHQGSTCYAAENTMPQDGRCLGKALSTRIAMGWPMDPWVRRNYNFHWHPVIWLQARMEHAPLKKGRRWGSWPRKFHPCLSSHA